jgi:IclR family transcriptional regulator, pca regulon regulatory protein
MPLPPPKGHMPENGAADSPLFNMSLSRGIAVILAFSGGKRDMNLRELAEATGLTKSAVQRFTFTLESLGLLTKDPQSKRYQLSPRCLDLGYGYLRSNWLIDHANAYLLDLNRKCGETVNLSVPDGLDMVYVSRFPSHKYIAIHMPVGQRLPMFCTAAGRAYLSALPPQESDAAIARSRLHAYTPSTIIDPKRLCEVVEEARVAGFSWANEEYFRGDINLAIAVRDGSGRPIGAVNVALPTSRWSLESGKAEIAPMLLETMRAIGSSAPPH